VVCFADRNRVCIASALQLHPLGTPERRFRLLWPVQVGWPDQQVCRVFNATGTQRTDAESKAERFRPQEEKNLNLFSINPSNERPRRCTALL
jgi:hypothetical protein